MREMLTLEFCIDGAAYRNEDGSIDLAAVAKTLRNCSSSVEGGMSAGLVIDLNGNNVGKFEITSES